jgi:ABC-type transport system involved in multi-copper enzyme maturation permease subunit
MVMDRIGSPVVLIARREILEHLLSLRFLVSTLMVALLLAVSMFVMVRDYRVRLENFAVLEKRAVPRAGEYDVMAVVPPRALSVFARGLDDLMDRGYDISAYRGITPHDRQTPATSLFTLFSPPDLLYVVKVLLSLVALLLSYDAISGEKERGTLRLVLSWPVSRAELVAGKLAGSLAVVWIPFATVFLASVAALVIWGHVAFGGGDFARMALMLGASLVYVAFFLALGTLVSALSPSSPRALVAALFVWALVVFAVPSAGQLVAAQLSPMPSTQTQEALRWQAFAKNRFLAIRSEGRDPEGRVEAFNRDYDRLVERTRAAADALVSTSKRLCRLSPSASLTYVFTDLAGTGIGDLRNLNRALARYKAANLSALVHQSDPGVPPPPPFSYEAARLGSTWRQGLLVDVILLVLVAQATGVAAVVAAIRTDPR